MKGGTPKGRELARKSAEYRDTQQSGKLQNVVLNCRASFLFLLLSKAGLKRITGYSLTSRQVRHVHYVMHDVTLILSAIEQGDPHASEKLLPLVYDELRKLASIHLSRESSGHTLQATALVHEAYLRLVGTGDEAQHWANRRHFFAAAAESMRRILVENARRKRRIKHGGEFARRELDEIPVVDTVFREDLLELDAALTKLAKTNPEAAELIELRYFAGMTMPEAAAALGISERTAARLWSYAKAWLLREIEGTEAHCE